MSFGLGLGLGLGAQPARGKPSARDTICKAIKEQHNLVATIDDNRVLLEPYALLNIEGEGMVLEAVTTLTEGAPAAWGLERIALGSIKAAEVHDSSFFPNSAFDRSRPEYASAVCVVEPVENIDDALKAQSGGS